MHKRLVYTKCWIVLILIFVLTLTQRIAAQELLVDLHLLAWSSDGTFLLGATPDQVMTLPNGSSQQQQILWRLAADGSEKQQLAKGFDPQLSSDGRFVTFTQLNAQNQLSSWGIDVETGALQPLGISFLSTLDVAIAGDPPGRMYISPDGKKRAILVNEFFTASLWIGEKNAPAQLILSSDGELLSDLAWRPDGEALVFIRTPLGSQTNTGGELWRIDLSPMGNAPTRLSQNNVVDRSPVWSPDGTSLTVVRNEQMVFVPSNQLLVEEFTLPEPVASILEPSPIGTAAQLIPPTHIKVIHHASNTCRAVPVGQIDTIPFEDYVKRVVPYEVFPSWPAETLKAQAVAARTYGWDKYLQNPGGSFHVTDWVNHQYMCDNTFASTNTAVDATSGEYLAYNGQMITAMFSAENSSPTKTNTNVNYLHAVDDPVSFGQTRNGHGYGMGQWGAQRWADQHQWSYQAILRHYYSNVTLEEAGVPADTAPPNVSLVVPWSNHYVTSNNLWLLMNTSDDGGNITQTNAYLTTSSETNLLLSEAGPANQAGYVIDISAWADQVLLTNTLVLTAEALDVTGKRGVVSPTVTVGVDRVAPTALLTTATTLSGTTVINDSPVVSLTLTSFDITAGATHIALGRKGWEWGGGKLNS